jgi:hypothetical protein
MNTMPIEFERARALIRNKVRERLRIDPRTDIWQTDYFISQVGLGSVAYNYLDARLPDNSIVPVDTLLDVVVEEFRDYVLVLDHEHEVVTTVILRCSRCGLNIASPKLCPSCENPVFFQTTEVELDNVLASLMLASRDPIGRRFLASIERVRLEFAYSKSVTYFEVFHKDLNDFAFTSNGKPVSAPTKGDGNLFQRIDDTLAWFVKYHNYQIAQKITTDQMTHLVRVFQKRHVLMHSGLINEKYCKNTGEDRQLIGQPVQLEKSEVIEAVQILKQIVTAAHVHFAP